MDLSRFEIVGIRSLLLHPPDVFCSGIHHLVFRACLEFFVCVSEEVVRARVESPDTFPARVFNDIISKDIALISILVSLLGFYRARCMEYIALVGVLMSYFVLSLRSAFRSLNCTRVG